MQDTGYRIQDAGYRIQDTDYRIEDTGYRIQDIELSFPELGADEHLVFSPQGLGEQGSVSLQHNPQYMYIQHTKSLIFENLNLDFSFFKIIELNAAKTLEALSLFHKLRFSNLYIFVIRWVTPWIFET